MKMWILIQYLNPKILHGGRCLLHVHDIRGGPGHVLDTWTAQNRSQADSPSNCGSSLYIKFFSHSPLSTHLKESLLFAITRHCITQFPFSSPVESFCTNPSKVLGPGFRTAAGPSALSPVSTFHSPLCFDRHLPVGSGNGETTPWQETMCK
jgi:hypothetical protein